MEGNHTPQDSGASFPIENPSGIPEKAMRKERAEVSDLLTDSGIPKPPDFNVENRPADTLITGIPEYGTPASIIEDDTTLVYEAPKKNQPGDEIVSRTLQIGKGKMITPEQQRSDNIEYIKNKFPIGSVINCDSERKIADDDNLTYGVVESVNKDDNGIFVTLWWYSLKNDRTGFPGGLKKKGDFDPNRLLELNKGTRDVKKDLVKDINDGHEVAKVLLQFVKDA